MGGFLLDEKKFVNDNVFLHEDKINSQYTRFLDSTPTYVNYYNINRIETTADNGFGSVERILGANSPIRFSEIKDLPIYGLEQIVLDLQNEEQGLDTSFEGSAVILPNTVKPLPNDMFTISYLNQNYLFMVIEVAYDTLKSNNFYKITYSIKSLNEEAKANLLNQTNDKFNCIVENIGTQEKVLIREDDVIQLRHLNRVYGNIAQDYKLMFYNEKYNSFLYKELDGTVVYDKYLTEFINKTGILNEKRDFKTIFLTNEDKTSGTMLEYHNSFFRALEKKNVADVKPETFLKTYVRNHGSIFSFYRDGSVRSSLLGSGVGIEEYIRHSLIEKIKTPPESYEELVAGKTLIDFFNGKISTIYELDIESLDDHYGFMAQNRDTFILVPALLYVLRYYYDKFMSIT